MIKHLQWLLLAILKPLDSQRQLCKSISKLVTIYFIPTFCWHFCVYFWQAQAFLLHLDGFVIEKIWRFWFFTWPHNWSVSDFLGGAPSSWFNTLTSLGDHGPCECGDKTNLIGMRARDRCVTGLWRWGSLILSHHSAKFGDHRPCESGDIMFFICHVTTTSNCHVALWVASPHPKSPPCYNQFHNILRPFDVSTNFPFTTSETMCKCYL